MKAATAVVCALALPAALAQPERPAPPANEPAVQRKVIEDDGVRIEELRVRGLTRSISVQSKVGGARRYEILPAAGGSDPSQPGAASGQRVWNVLSF